MINATIKNNGEALLKIRTSDGLFDLAPGETGSYVSARPIRVDTEATYESPFPSQVDVIGD